MQEKISSILLILVLTIFVDVNAQFRDSNWGDTKDQVITIEGEPDHTDANGIYYEGSAGGNEAIIFFQFIDNSLHIAGYMFQETHSNDRLYITDFDDLSEILSRRYGDPDNSDPRFVLNSSTATNEYIDEGTKLSIGAIGYQNTWTLDQTIILHKLAGDNYDITHSVAYKSKDYDELSKQDAIDDF